jgi:hypothetical protein
MQPLGAGSVGNGISGLSNDVHRYILNAIDTFSNYA